MAFAASAGRVAENYAIRNQAQLAAVYVSQFLAPRLVPGDFFGPRPAKRVQFEFALRDLIGKAGIVHVTVWNRNSDVLYSDDASVAPRALPMSPALQGALRGQLQWQLLYVGDPAVGRVEIFVPVVVAKGTPPVGVYRVVSELSDLAPMLARLKWSVWGSVIAGILVLYGVLFTIVRQASRDLERQEGALRRMFAGAVQSLANAVGARDNRTGHHSSLVAYFAVATAKELGLGAEEIHHIQLAAGLHDLGKIGIRDDVLAKPGPLTDEEWKIMRAHPLLGYEILRPVPIADEIKLGIRHSHERWDGTGYPDGLAGESIPIVARVIGVADAFEALTTDRPYRRARSPRKALEEIQRAAATQFDPRVVDAFTRIFHQSGRPKSGLRGRIGWPALR